MDMDDWEKRLKFELFSTYLHWQLTLNENDIDFRTSVQFSNVSMQWTNSQKWKQLFSKEWETDSLQGTPAFITLWPRDNI